MHEPASERALIRQALDRHAGNRARAAYRLAINEYMGVETPQLMVEYLE